MQLRTDNFRKDLVSSLSLKVIDFVCHVVFAIGIVVLFKLPWWMVILQWIPDIYMIPLLIYSTITGEYVSSGNLLLQAHKFAHYKLAPVVVGLCAAAIHTRFTLIYFLSYTTHLLVDVCTHEEDWII